MNLKSLKRVTTPGVHMNITSVSFSGTNPSLGPYNRKARNTLNVTTYPDELRNLLDGTLVNGVMSLREYLKLLIEKNYEETSKVASAYDPGELNKGERIIDLNFTFADGTRASIDDLRTISLSGKGYQSFEALIREKGVRYVEPDERVLEEPELDDSIEWREDRERERERKRKRETSVPLSLDLDDDN